MASELTRVVSSKSTIPVYTTLSGTLTTSAITTILTYAGVLTLQDVFGEDYQKAWANNLWVYGAVSNTNGEVRRITGANTNDGGTTWNIIIESAFTTALASEDLKIVTANLQDYSCANQGGADGIYDGVTIVAGATIPRRENSNRRAATRNREAKAINATGTSFLIEENK